MGFDNQKAVEIYAEKTELFLVEKKVFLQYLKESMYILDLGCGTGRTSRHLKDMGHDVLGVDISSLMIERAKELHPDIWFRVADAQELPYSDKTFDVVLFSFNGLDYIYPEQARSETIKKIYDVLKPGGIFIYSTHSLSATANRKRNWRRRPRHYRGYYHKEKTVYGDLITYYGTKKRNLNMLKACGFRDPKYYDNEGETWRYYVAWK